MNAVHKEIYDDLDADVWSNLTGEYRYHYFNHMRTMVWNAIIGRGWEPGGFIFNLDSERDPHEGPCEERYSDVRLVRKPHAFAFCLDHSDSWVII